MEARVDDLTFFRGEAIRRPANDDLGATMPPHRRRGAAEPLVPAAAPSRRRA